MSVCIESEDLAKKPTKKASEHHERKLKILNSIENAWPTFSHAESERKAAEDDERMFKLCKYPPESL